jgi:putative proteasome-type protease
MTYCVGMVTDRGLVLMSDTRTNSGVDNISVFRKMFHWSVPGERIVVLMTAGNLATTQAVISHLEERTKAPEERQHSLLGVPTMFQAAVETGRALRDVVLDTQNENGEQGRGRFTASLILAGQLKGMEPRLFLIYPEGNFIEASWDTPFFQIGETKYGRRFLIRGYDRYLSF